MKLIRILCVALLLSIFLVGVSHAGSFTLDRSVEALGYETLTPTTSTGITSSLLVTANRDVAKFALISVEVASINFTLDGTAPTNDAANKGHQMLAGEYMIISGVNDLSNFRCIEKVGANGAIVKVTTLF